MRLLQQSELRVKRSRYFPKSRTQPYVVTLIQSLIAFRRLAKRLKAKSVTLRRVFNTGDHKRNYLEHEIVSAHNCRLDAKFGAPVITLTNITPPVLAETRYRDADTGHVFHDQEEAHEAEKRNLVTLKKPFIPRKKRLRLTLFRRVKEKMENEKNQVALGVSGIAPKKLRKKLRNMDEELAAELKQRLRERDHHHKHGHKHGHHHGHGHHRGHSPSPEHHQHHEHGHHHHHDDDDNASKVQQLAVGKQDVTEGVIEKYIDYLPGTEIYYGHAISLQARHGGFLSFFEFGSH